MVKKSSTYGATLPTKMARLAYAAASRVLGSMWVPYYTHS